MSHDLEYSPLAAVFHLCKHGARMFLSDNSSTKSYKFPLQYLFMEFIFSFCSAVKLGQFLNEYLTLKRKMKLSIKSKSLQFSFLHYLFYFLFSFEPVSGLSVPCTTCADGN